LAISNGSFARLGMPASNTSCPDGAWIAFFCAVSAAVAFGAAGVMYGMSNFTLPRAAFAFSAVRVLLMMFSRAFAMPSRRPCHFVGSGDPMNASTRS
jgi:hypothetical protein